MYPADGIAGYARDQFVDDLLRENETEIRRCLQKGAHKVQIDFKGRLAMKIDPSGHLLTSFIDLNNLSLSRFSAEDRSRAPRTARAPCAPASSFMFRSPSNHPNSLQR